jgi:NADH:ubiquinone oxidoreductase subunit 2 (subunit N)
MYLSEGSDDDPPLAFPFTLRTGLIVATIGIVLLGVYPQPFIALAQNAIAPLVATTSR